MFDTAVIGGGLAGCNAAIALAQRNHRVLLLEAGTYPRPKVCGEFLSPESLALFAASGFLTKLRSLNPVPIHTVRITAPDGSQWCSAFPAPALGISRFALDQALAEYAASLGVEVHDGTRVTQINGSLRDGFSLTAQTNGETRTFHAAGVIATYGRRGNLDRVLNRRFRKEQPLYVGLKQHFTGPPLPRHIDLHVFRGGYCGMSDVEDGTANVCLLIRQDVFQEVSAGSHDPVAQFVGWMCGQNPQLGRWLSQASPVYPEWLSIAQVSLAAKSPIERDILLAGDSAGMVAPLAGDGMAMALHSGVLAATALDNYLRNMRDADAMKGDYERTWRRTFGARMRLGRILQSVMLRPRLLAPGLRLLSRFPAAGDWLVHHTRDLRLLKETT